MVHGGLLHAPRHWFPSRASRAIPSRAPSPTSAGTIPGACATPPTTPPDMSPDLPDTLLFYTPPPRNEVHAALAGKEILGCFWNSRVFSSVGIVETMARETVQYSS